MYNNYFFYVFNCSVWSTNFILAMNFLFKYIPVQIFLSIYREREVQMHAFTVRPISHTPTPKMETSNV